MTFYITPYTRRAPRNWSRSVYAGEQGYHLAVDLRESDEEYTLQAIVPGLKSEDVNIQVLDDVVTISGEFKGSEDGENLLCELPRGSFHRHLRLPVPLNAEKAEARIVDGILTLRLPKAEEAKPRIIKINAK